MKQKIRMEKLAQYRHIKVLNSLEKQSRLAYKLVMTSAIHEIKSILRSEKLAKSDDEEKLPEGWTDEAPRVEFDISGIINRVLDRHLSALRWVMMGDYAGKDAKAAAKEVGLVGKITPGLVPSAYLQSIDCHREHHEEVTGESAPDMPKDLLKESIKRIVQRADKFMKQFFESLKTATMHVVDKVAELRNYQILGKVLEGAHDNLPKDGKDAVSVAAEGISDRLSIKELGKELDLMSENFENKWDLASMGEIAAGSAVGTHQAMYEVYGASTDNIRVAWIEMEDERVCSFCRNASKNPDGSHKYYKITDFKPTGYNYGKKKSDWQLTIVPAHPRCRCQLVYVPAGFEVDSEGSLVKKKTT